MGGGVIRVDFDGFVAVPDAGVGSFQLEEAVASLGEHGRGLGVEEDGFGEEVGRFLVVTRCDHFQDSCLLTFLQLRVHVSQPSQATPKGVLVVHAL